MRLILKLILCICLIAGTVTFSPEADARRRKAPAKREATTKASSKKQTKKPAKKQAPRTAGDVRREKKKTAGEIARTEKDIAENARQTRRQLSRLGSLDTEIKASTARVSSLQSDVDAIRARVKALSDTVERTEKTVDRLRQSYTRNLTAMRRQRQGVSDLSFIFSAGNFTEMMSRARYLRELSAAQSGRARELKIQLDSLRVRRARLDSLEASLNAVLASHKAENTRLQASRASATQLVDSLKRNGSSLKKVLSEKQALARRLDAELDRIIAEEARKAAEEEARRKKAEEEARRKAEAEAAERRRSEEAAAAGKDKPQKGKNSTTQKSKPAPATKPAAKPKQEIKPTEAGAALNGGFAANKGMLPSPVDRSYTITSAFGRTSHPELSRIDVQNNGIDLRTGAGASARAVFRGTVSSIFRLDGYQNIVILRHGSYLTVYAGIGELKVRKGQEVTAGQILGTLAADPDDPGHATLHFEIRNEKTKLNPAEWLRR